MSFKQQSAMGGYGVSFFVCCFVAVATWLMPYAHPSSSVGAEIRGHRGSKLGLASAFTYPTRPTCTDTG